MNRIARFVLWLCRNFTRQELEQIILQLQAILTERNPEIKPRDDFQQQHPHYRDFYVDSQAPFQQPPAPPRHQPTLDWQKLCANYQIAHGRPLAPVLRRGGQKIPATCHCGHCGAPPAYLYFNNGFQGSQLLCKVCRRLSMLAPRHRSSQACYWCPYCHSALYRWKQLPECTLYKCPKDTCPHYVQRKNSLSWNEKLLQKLRPSHFKLRYQYRQYHFQPRQLIPTAPLRPSLDLQRIHRSSDVLGLVLAFHISFALSARKTALLLRQVFSMTISYQTVHNYTQAAAYYCHLFNLRYKSAISSTTTGDETYIRIAGRHHFSFLFLDPVGHQITAYHVAAERDTLAATTAMAEAARTLPLEQSMRYIVDGNPSYMAGLHFLNEHRLEGQSPHTLLQVLGLQNLDAVSEQYRPFKQLIERLNRTYKFHVRHACGFETRNGAVALTALFVTFYNFLRPHMALNYRCPIQLPELSTITTLQGKWLKILQLALAA